VTSEHLQKLWQPDDAGTDKNESYAHEVGTVIGRRRPRDRWRPRKDMKTPTTQTRVPNKVVTKVIEGMV